MRANPAVASQATKLGLWDGVSIIIGIVIGAGIFETPPLVFQNVSGPWSGLGVWLLGGVLSLIGALCYAELASTYPRSGGDYVYLTRAYGSWVGFLFGWAQLAVILTGSIGMVAYVFADYAVRLGLLGTGSTFFYAASAIAILTLMNMAGIVWGRRTQNWLSAAKVLGLAGILLAGFFWTQPAGFIGSEGKDAALWAASERPATSGSFAFAMVLVFVTYGGWNDAAYVAAEVRNGKRTIPLVLILGTAAITAIYMLVNAAYLWALGFEGVRSTKAVAADLLARPFGAWGANVMCLLVMISALGAVNGLIFTGSRLYATLGRDHKVLGWLGQFHSGRGSPAVALAVQGVISLGIVAAVGTEAGRTALGSILGLFTAGDVAWEGHGGFETLLRCTAPVFWAFFLLTGISLFVLRRMDREIERPFSVPLYPVLPLVFCLTCAYMFYSGLLYAGKLGLVGGVLLLAGLPLYWFSRWQARSVVAGVRLTEAQPVSSS